jgi:uncharacterized protein (DUF1800 family)
MTTDLNNLLFITNRLGYGPRAEDFATLSKQSADNWLEEQLISSISKEIIVDQHLAKTKLHIKYDASPDKWPAVDEMRSLSNLNKPVEQLWEVFDPKKQLNGQEKGLPRLETVMSTMTYAVYSRYQLREVMSQFWHDHFHVNAFLDDHIAVGLPIYDRDVIRKHALGNFRTMLEAVATSTSMQYYLTNHSSRAGAANENYARELFELHTLGREAYLNDHYDRWHEVPGASSGYPQGYIDQDVYEAARAFTGWTIEDGASIDGGRKLPATGKFVYVENWHDGYQKRVLAAEFEPFGKPMADGHKVLDLVAEHPATAKHLSKKLCVRLIGENASDAIVTQTTALLQKTAHAPDQIAQIVRFIAKSPEFLQSNGQKVKRPLGLMANFVRIMGYDFTPSEGLNNQLANAGQKLFGAPTPVGLPDQNKIFIGANAMRNRWQLLLGLAQNSWGNGISQPSETLAAWGIKNADNNELAAQIFRLFGSNQNQNTISATMMASGMVPFANSDIDPESQKHLAMVFAIAAMSPEFQTC